MSSYTGLSPKNPNKYTGPVNFISSVVTRNRRPTSADYRQPETGKIYPFGSFWLVGEDPSTGTQGEMWYLSKVEANVAYWIQLAAGGGSSFVALDVPLGVTTIEPDGIGTITFTSTGGTVNITGSAADPNNNFVNFDLAGGLPPVNQITVDDFDAPGVNPVVPTAGGEFTFSGSSVINQNIPVQTYTNAPNEFDLQVQIATSNGTPSASKNGLCHFDSSMFIVDVNGFVQLFNSTAPINGLGVEATSGTGTDPVLPDGSGNIQLQGSTASSGANPVRVVSPSVNTAEVQVQISQALAATDATKVGLANFNSANFDVDANGFVSLTSSGAGQTITGDSGGALSPTGSNWDILGRSGSKTSGSGSTLTIQSPPFSQVGSSATSVLNSGEIVTAAVTRTLPATAGLMDGDLVILSCTTAGALVVTANTGQIIRIGASASSSGGTATSTAIGDSLTLRFDATAIAWRAVSVQGNWITA